MNSDFFRGRLLSFKYAWNGVCDLIKKEKNTRIHLFFTILVIIFGFLLKIAQWEWCILVMTIAAVWSAEAMNTALERNVDLVTLEKRPLAKEAKDLAAGAVLIFAIMSVIIGLIIFLPKLLLVLSTIFH